MPYEATVHRKALDLVWWSMEMTSRAGSGHPTSAASVAHLVTVLLYDHMRHDPARPRHPGADCLVLSQGHAVPAVYAAGADLGIEVEPLGEDPRPMERRDLEGLRQVSSFLDGHPNPALGFPLLHGATGSLGQGLSLAAGLALSARLDKLGRRVFCIVGDGESREGQIWEALDFIADHELSTVCPIFNCNGWGQSGRVSPQQAPDALARRIEAMGFEARLIDGHAPWEVKRALEDHAQNASRRVPFAIVARTVKGWGVPSLQGRNMHGRVVSESELPAVEEEIRREAERLGARHSEGVLRIPPVPAVEVDDGNRLTMPDFASAVRARGQAPGDGERWATRRAYGLAIRALGHAHPRVVVLDGDVRDSTFSGDFHDDKLLRHRFFEGGIAEQNLVSTAAGMALGGHVPFVSSFGKFVTRAYDQLEMAVLSGANLKLVGSHVGVSLAADGPSQMALPDVAWFRSLSKVRRLDGRPAMYVIHPCDARSTYSLAELIAVHDGPCYLRLMRPGVEHVYGDGTPFGLEAHQEVRKGEGLVLAAWGYMVHEALEAMALLARDGIHPTLLDLYCLPLNRQALVDVVKRHRAGVLTLEDNYGGGMGSEVAETLAEEGVSVPVRQMYVRRLPKSGRTAKDVLRYVGLEATQVASAAREMVRRGM